VDNYQLGAEISTGGMGSVLEAHDAKLDRTVAIKVMLLEANADARMRARFLREAQVLAKLAHPNIVPIYDIVWEDGMPLFYSMKLVKGRTLQAILNDLRKEDAAALRDYPLTRLLGIFRKVCDAIAFAHSQGVLHRDLKPENIMVGEFGEVLVMDWGLAKRRNDECGMTNDEITESEAPHSSFGIRHSPRPRIRLLTHSLARCSALPNTCPPSKPAAA
jgi:serine/threonine protein kinase